MTKLWRLSRGHVDDYDVYTDAIVAADSQTDALMIHPAGRYVDMAGWPQLWAFPMHITVEYLGTAKPGTKKGSVILAVFRAG